MNIPPIMSLALLLILTALFSAGLICFAQLRERTRPMTLLTVASVLVLCGCIWGYKDLEKRYERHYLLYEMGQILLRFDVMMASGQEKEVRQTLEAARAARWPFHPQRQNIIDLGRSLSGDMDTKPAPPAILAP